MIVLVASMARSRNPIGWVALSFVLTPFITALILRCLGKGPVQYVYVERDANGRTYFYDANGRPYFRDSDADSRRGGASRS